MRKYVILLVSFFVVCISLQKAEAQEDIDAYGAFKQVANMINASIDIDNNDYLSKFPTECKIVNKQFKKCSKYVNKAYCNALRGKAKDYKRNEQKALEYYTYGMFVYNEMLKKDGKPAYQEVKSRDNIALIILLNTNFK